MNPLQNDACWGFLDITIIKRQVAILPSMDKILRGYMFFMFYNDFSQYVSLFENKLSLKVTSTAKLFFAVK